MKLVFSNENSFIVNNVKNLIEAQSIEVFLKNEFAQGAMGEISPLDSWPEIWVVDDNDYEKVMSIVNSAQSKRPAMIGFATSVRKATMPLLKFAGIANKIVKAKGAYSNSNFPTRR